MNRIFRLGLVLIALALLATACGTVRPRVITLAGSSAGYADGSGSTAQFSGPLDVAVDTQGNVYVADSANHRIRKVAPDGAASLMVVTLAGRDEVFPVDGPLSEAVFSTPTGIAFAASGALYVADSAMKDPHPMRVRVITPAGMVTTLAGSGQAGYVDGVGLDAQFRSPASLAVDQAGNVYVADTTNNRIRKITPDGATSFIVTTLAGSTETGYAAGYADGPASQALFQDPRSVDVDGAGNVYVADTGNHCIRVISPSGQVTTLAGTPEPGYTDGQGAAARFNFPSGIAVDAQGNVYVADTANHRIRKIAPDGTVTTLAGSGTPGNADGPATEARFRGPEGVAVDSAGNVYVADTGNHRIRKIVIRD